MPLGRTGCSRRNPGLSRAGGEGRSRHERHQSGTLEVNMNEVTPVRIGYVYVAAAYDDGLVKIGYTYQKPSRRMQQLSTGLAGRFQLLHVIETTKPERFELNCINTLRPAATANRAAHQAQQGAQLVGEGAHCCSLPRRGGRRLRLQQLGG